MPRQERHGRLLVLIFLNPGNMKSPNRDLLVLLKDETMSEQAIEQEVEKLNTMLFNVETSDSFYSSHELIDMNRFRIIHDKKQLQLIAREKSLKPFLFLCNLN
jgi:tRNA G10  N-methylase Trm11